jgi:hypothetical protein
VSERPSHTESELIEFVRSIDVRAPEELHGRIEALVSQRSARGPRRPLRARPSGNPSPLGWRLGGAIAIVTAAAVALVLALAGRGSPALNVRQASALTLRPATMAPPAENPRARTQLAATVDGVAFPYWEERFGWRSTGARSDRIGGRTVTTVFYTNARGQRIGYAIVAGTPAPRAGGGVVTWRGDTPYRLLSEDGFPVVSWLRDGHLCIVAGRGVRSGTLLQLASWDDRGAVA